MRYAALLAVILCFPCVILAQSKKDYERTMARFVKFYNSNQGDSIVSMWVPKDRKSIERLWTKSEVAKLHNQYGKISSVKYKSAGKEKDQGVAFETIFSKLEPNGSTIQMDSKGHITMFLLINSEPKEKQPKKGKK